MHELPTKIKINDKEYEIRHDFRPCLDIMIMFENVNLTENEKLRGMLDILFIDEVSLCNETVRSAVEFLDLGTIYDNNKNGSHSDRFYSWKQDRQYIFSAIDRVLGFSCRRCEYLHWWEFMGAFMEIGECTFSTIVHLRKQKQKNKLTKEEREYWAENRDILELKRELTTLEQAAVDNFLELVNGGD